ncbi:MAG TPA: hypothetical protein VF121_05990 [Thermoanaerobaculia bacterium]|nr:hypothetical protein [Thermoanaerobaculia bacterium]
MPSLPSRLSALALLLALTPAAARAQGKPDWTFSLAQGEALPSSVVVRNRCLDPHDFRVSAPGTPWATLDRPAERLRVAPRSSIELEVRFDTAGLAPGLHRGELLVECLTCRREQRFLEEEEEGVTVRNCQSEPQRFPVAMTVVAAAAPAAATSPAPPRRAASEVRNIETAMRDRMGAALRRLAEKRGLAVLPETLTVLSLPGGGLVAGVRVGTDQGLSAAQLAAGADTMFLHLELEGTPAGEYTLAVRLPAAGKPTAQLLDAEGAVVRELPVSSERLDDGCSLYAAQLAPQLEVPVWCVSAPAPAGDRPAGKLWRGWPLHCLPSPGPTAS